MDLISLITFIQANPKLSLFIISVVLTFIITLISYWVTDHVKMKGIKEKQKRLREEMKIHKENPQKMMEIQKQMMEDFPHQMKESMKTSMITLIPMIFLFKWLSTVYATTTIASSWIWWYIGFSIVSSIVLRKLFKMD
jgi:uncharacterized membrane protein (DUF106 family)